jgi:predicted DCC family thiol-disulfide oxidoreductase YuxK
MSPVSAVVLFDGVCNLCNGLVDFILDRDPEGYFRFAAIQSEVGGRMLRDCGLDPDALDTLVLVEDGVCHTRSAAALRIARRLGFPSSLAYPLVVLPRSIRDAGYRWIASNRYRWFGRRHVCRTPSAADRRRFLE